MNYEGTTRAGDEYSVSNDRSPQLSPSVRVPSETHDFHVVRLGDDRAVLKTSSDGASDDVVQRLVNEASMMRSAAAVVADVPFVGGGSDPVPHLLTEYRAEWRSLAVVADELAGPILRPFARALFGHLRDLHKAGFIHRDVKPSNILVAVVEDGFRFADLVLVDYGVALATNDIGRDPAAMFTEVGTRGWKAPECVGRPQLDDKGDVFAAALVVYSLATGRPTPLSTSLDADEVAASLHDLDPEVTGDPDLDLVLRQALSFRPGDRPSARQLIEQLDGPLPLGSGDEAEAPIPADEEPQPSAGVAPAIAAEAGAAESPPEEETLVDPVVEETVVAEGSVDPLAADAGALPIGASPQEDTAPVEDEGVDAPLDHGIASHEDGATEAADGAVDVPGPGEPGDGDAPAGPAAEPDWWNYSAPSTSDFVEHQDRALKLLRAKLRTDGMLREEDRQGFDALLGRAFGATVHFFRRIPQTSLVLRMRGKKPKQAEPVRRMRSCPICLHEFDWATAWWLVPAPDHKDPESPDLNGSWWEVVEAHEARARAYVDDPEIALDDFAIAICPSDASRGEHTSGSHVLPPWEEDRGQSSSAWIGLPTDRTKALHPMDPSYGISQSFFIGVVGLSGSGKSSWIRKVDRYLTEFNTWCADRQLGIELQRVPGVLSDYYRPNPEDSTADPDLVSRGNAGGTGWQTYFTVRATGYDPRILEDAKDRKAARRQRKEVRFNLIFADYAGEDFTDDQRNNAVRNRTLSLRLAKGIVCMVSAEELPAVRRMLEGTDPETGEGLRSPQPRAQFVSRATANMQRLPSKADPNPEKRRVAAAYVLSKSDYLVGADLFQDLHVSLTDTPEAVAGSSSVDAKGDLLRALGHLGQAQTNRAPNVAGAFEANVRRLPAASAVVAGLVQSQFPMSDARVAELLQSDTYAPMTAHAISAKSGAGTYEPLLALLLHMGMITEAKRR